MPHILVKKSSPNRIPFYIALQLLKAHSLPKGQYSPKSLFKLISEEKLINADEVIPIDIKDHFYDQAVNRGFMDARHHRGKRQQIINGEGKVFKPEGGYSKYRNPVDYVKALTQVFLHEHGINHPSQIGENGMMLHFGDRDRDMYKDKSKKDKNYLDANIGGYTAVIEPNRANPEQLALVSMYSDNERAHTRDENKMMGKTYSLFDDIPGLGSSYMSDSIGNNGLPVVNYDERRSAAQPPKVEQTRQVIPSMAKNFLDEHFQHEDNQHTNGKRMFSFTGKGAKWAAGKTLPSGWNNDMNRTANVIGSALNQLYANSELGMSTDDVHSLGENMYGAWRQHYEDKQATPYNFNSVQLPPDTPGAHVVNPDMTHSDMMMTGEPMDIAFQLLKGSTKQSTLWGYDPKIVNDLLAVKNSNIFIAAKPGRDAMPVNEQNRRSDKMLQELTELKEKHGDFDITSATGRAGWEAEPSFMLTNVPDTARDAINQIAAKYKQDSIGVSERGEQGVNYVTPKGETVEDGKFSGMEIQENPEYSTDFPSGQRLTFTYGEPMELALQLLKERKSPEAMRHKREYDTQYESSPERVKYREELNRERKRRGIYGSHNHQDVSHSQGGKLTLEGEHANRARHFKNKGTLRRINKMVFVR